MEQQPLKLPTPAKIRTRPNLTSVQITDDQKLLIDQAYKIFNGTNERRVTKGQFLAIVAVDYLKRQ